MTIAQYSAKIFNHPQKYLRKERFPLWFHHFDGERNYSSYQLCLFHATNPICLLHTICSHIFFCYYNQSFCQDAYSGTVWRIYLLGLLCNTVNVRANSCGLLWSKISYPSVCNINSLLPIEHGQWCLNNGGSGKLHPHKQRNTFSALLNCPLWWFWACYFFYWYSFVKISKLVVSKHFYVHVSVCLCDLYTFSFSLCSGAGSCLAPACSGPAFFLTHLKSAPMVTGRDTCCHDKQITYRRWGIVLLIKTQEIRIKNIPLKRN